MYSLRVGRSFGAYVAPLSNFERLCGEDVRFFLTWASILSFFSWLMPHVFFLAVLLSCFGFGGVDRATLCTFCLCGTEGADSVIPAALAKFLISSTLNSILTLPFTTSRWRIGLICKVSIATVV